MLDSGNQFGPLVAIGTVVKLGYRSKDIQGTPRVIQCIGGVQCNTIGIVRLRYHQDQHSDEVLQDDFHVLEHLTGDYQVILPTEAPAEEGTGPPLVGAMVAARRSPTQGELPSHTFSPSVSCRSLN